MRSEDLDFSFSGLKTAVLYKIKEIAELDEHAKMRIATEFEEAVTDVLIAKVRRALSDHDAATFVLGGGVAANQYIRTRLTQLFEESHNAVAVEFPPKGLSTDNAIMIGMAAYLQYAQNKEKAFLAKDAVETMRADGKMSL
jgi:N6-L-threonylcarbamoyladenine synthase